MILREIEKFIADTGMSVCGFGRKAMNDPALVSDLRGGRQLRTKSQTRVREFMEEYRRG